jgi:hypothetical protein
LILRSLNDNQRLILKTIAKNDDTLTSQLTDLSISHEIPLSTLKLNARILRDMNLISYGTIKNKKNARIETLGELVIKITEDKPSIATILLDS